jgi:protein TonB
MKNLLLPVFLCFCTSDFAQTTNNQIFTYPDEVPVFDGNYAEYIADHTMYPKAAKDSNIQGRVTVRFMVNEDGSISDVSVIHSVNPLLDSEAVRVVRYMPHWKPGKQNGKLVKVWYNLPFNFKLPDPEPPKK